jgi:hypothetical protein
MHPCDPDHHDGRQYDNGGHGRMESDVDRRETIRSNDDSGKGDERFCPSPSPSPTSTSTPIATPTPTAIPTLVPTDTPIATQDPSPSASAPS